MQKKVRMLTHIAFSILLILVIVSFEYVIQDASVITKLFVFAGYTYGPLLGLFSFGILTSLKPHRYSVPVIAIISPFIAYTMSVLAEKAGFEFGFFILLLNGAITFSLLLIASILLPSKSAHN